LNLIQTGTRQFELAYSRHLKIEIKLKIFLFQWDTERLSACCDGKIRQAARDRVPLGGIIGESAPAGVDRPETVMASAPSSAPALILKDLAPSFLGPQTNH
jgi:hypothetical protein